MVSVGIGVVIFATMMVGVLLRDNNVFVAITYIGYCLAIVLIYSKIVKHGLKFTAHEERTFFAVHVIRRNIAAKQRAIKRSRRRSSIAYTTTTAEQDIIANIVGTPKSPTVHRKTFKKTSPPTTVSQHKVVPLSPTTHIDEDSSGRSDEVIRLKPVPLMFSAKTTQSTAAANEVMDFDHVDEDDNHVIGHRLHLPQESKEEQMDQEELLVLQNVHEEDEEDGEVDVVAAGGSGVSSRSSLSTIKLHYKVLLCI